MSLAEETEAGSAEYRERLLALVGDRGGDTARAFAAAYMRRLSIEGISAEHLAAEVLGAYAFANERGRAPVGVRALNPTLHDEGYEPLGSVLETNSDDWPFLVDSVSAALEARAELDQTQAHLARFGDRLPKPIRDQFTALKERLG